MPDVHRIERFLHAMLRETSRLDAGAPGARVRPFVTISRQAGAGGHTLAETLVEVFARQPDDELFGGWQLFDQKVCELAVEDPRLAQSIDALVAEDYRTRTDEFISQIIKPAPDQDYVMGRVFRVVRALAGVGKAIIIGRAGSEVTRGLRPGFSLRLVAAEEDRIARMMELHGVGERQARDLVRRQDAARARLLKRHFHVDIADPAGYDAVWNTSLASFEEIAEAVTTVVRLRAAAIGAGVGAAGN